LNRNVLTWLKSWESIVFPGRPKINLRLPDSVTNAPGAKFKKDLAFRKVDAQGNVYHTFADQEFSCENKKIVTLYGPPGTGKSTMARVLARQCGYEPKEINASTMGSPAALIEAMTTAVT